jgi:hypothetical protein
MWGSARSFNGQAAFSQRSAHPQLQRERYGCPDLSFTLSLPPDWLWRSNSVTLATSPREVSQVKAEFYDVKKREKITADVTEKVTYGEGDKLRYAFRAKTPDGRNLTKFVGKAEWDQTHV